MTTPTTPFDLTARVRYAYMEHEFGHDNVHVIEQLLINGIAVSEYDLDHELHVLIQQLYHALTVDYGVYRVWVDPTTQHIYGTLTTLNVDNGADEEADELDFTYETHAQRQARYEAAMTPQERAHHAELLASGEPF